MERHASAWQTQETACLLGSIYNSMQQAEYYYKFQRFCYVTLNTRLGVQQCQSQVLVVHILFLIRFNS